MILILSYTFDTVYSPTECIYAFLTTVFLTSMFILQTYHVSHKKVLLIINYSDSDSHMSIKNFCNLLCFIIILHSLHKTRHSLKQFAIQPLKYDTMMNNVLKLVHIIKLMDDTI